MFEAAELGRKITNSDYKNRVLDLRQELLEVQQELRKCDFPVILVFGGVDGAGKGDTVNLLNEWMDPRWLVTRAYVEPSQEEAERPEYWRYWRDLPPKGLIGMFLSSWYSRPILDRVGDEITPAEFDEKLERIASFENALAADGALIIKFWMHLSKKGQKTQLRALEKDPLLKWRVNETDWKHWRIYDKFISVAERAIMKTSTGDALWHIVEGADHNYRSLTVGKTLLRSIRKHIQSRAVQKEAEQNLRAVLKAKREAAALEEVDDRPIEERAREVKHPELPTVLTSLDMDKALGKKEYRTELKKLQSKLNFLQRRATQKGVSTLVVMEGWDAGGKGGAIRRCTQALDARHVQVYPFAAPTDEEWGHHYLWRFWRHLGRSGRVTFFDRSWYGRVLVERVERFATEDEWTRAYAEINDFEEQLAEHGIVLLKFWLHITPKEQLERFELRAVTPYKQWKLTEEDWRNREKWGSYEQAVNDMVTHTSTSIAPWTLVEGNDKRYTRIKVLRTLTERLEKALD
jgi:polyphosphate kinase 2 (PPK2 family)